MIVVDEKILIVLKNGRLDKLNIYFSYCKTDNKLLIERAEVLIILAVCQGPFDGWKGETNF